MLVDYLVSLYDLKRLGYDVKVEAALNDIGTEVFKITGVYENNKYRARSTLSNLLQRLGMDVGLSYAVVAPVEHIALDGKRVTCHRILGYERTDRKWLSSGHASDEAVMSSSKMSDMQTEIKTLGK